MIYGFNDDKEKVDIQNLLDTLQANFQNNVNTVYNAVVNNGVTPTAKTPSAIVTGINNIRSGGNASASEILANKTAYSGKTLRTGSMANYSGSNRRTVTPTGGTGNEQLSLASGYHDSVIVNRTAPYNAGKAAAEAVTWTETLLASAYRVSGSGILDLDFYIPYKNTIKIKNVSNKSIRLSVTKNTGTENVTLANNEEYTPNGNILRIMAGIQIESSALNEGITVEVTFQAKVLR